MKKGFTLVELLAVLVILGILFGLSVVFIFPIINEGKETTHKAQINTIIKSAYDYSLTHTEILPRGNEEYLIPLGLLKQEGLIETNLLDPETGSPFSDDLIIKVTNSSPSSDLEYKKEGSYYYVIDYNNDSSRRKPVITLASGDTQVNIQSGSATYTMPQITSVKYNNTTITNYETYISIVNGSSIVSSVDLTNYGVYKINYTIKASQGIVTKSITVTVNDLEAPTLTATFSTTQEIAKNSTIDLMQNISCSDNSGKCKIRIEGQVNTKKEGTYTIKYTALDDAGLKSQPITRIIKVV